MAHDDDETLARAGIAPIEEWWLSLARKLCVARWGDGVSLGTIGVRLAMRAGRPRPWSAMTMSRFFAGQPSAAIADALLAEFPSLLPRYAYYPRDEREALEYAEVRRRADTRRKSDTLAPLLDAVDRRAGIAPRTSGEVASRDVDEAAPGGVPGSRARGSRARVGRVGSGRPRAGGR